MDHEITFTVQRLPGRAGFHVRAGLRDTAIDFARAIELWQSDARFVHDFTHELRSCPFVAYFFELPALTRHSLHRPFEFVLIDSPALARVRADDSSFRAHFDPAHETATFRNLRGDAVLIAPCPSQAECAHLASFARTATLDQERALWRATAAALANEVGDTPRWLSTSGLGVPWLHLRIDTRPKYYSHAPYRAVPASGSADP